MEYVLREELRAHTGAVRACAYAMGDLLTGGEDAVVNRWDLNVNGSSTLGTANFDHNHSVLAVAPMEAGVLEECASGGFVTGSLDRSVRVYNLEGHLVRKLDGHAGGIISLSWTSDKKLVSGSWDGTAKVWELSTGSVMFTLGDHENGVSVLGLPNGDIATASTGVENEQKTVVDFRVRIWRGGTCIRTHADHSGPVRSLSLMPNGNGFMSASNDGTIVMRDLEGNAIAVAQHSATEFVYNVVPLLEETGAQFVSCSEDRCAVVWRGTEELQRIQHPNSVWFACALPDGDFATCCHDGVVRLFTRDPDRAASDQVQAAFTSAVADAEAKAKQGFSAEEVASLPRWETSASTPGNASGAIGMFQKDGKAIAAQWSPESGCWIEIGQVTGSKDGGILDGKTYDQIIPVDVTLPGGTGNVQLQLGYNNGENPYEAANRFIAAHGDILGPSNLEEIATFIMQRAGTSSTPMLGAEAARPQPTHSTVPETARVGAAQSQPRPPPSAFLKFDKGIAMEKTKAKINEFIDSLASDAGNSQHVPTESELADLHRLCDILGETSRWHTSSVSDGQVRVMLKLLRWPVKYIFPALDIMRILVLHPDGASKLSLAGSMILDVASTEHFVARSLAGDESLSPPPMAVRLLVARFLSNCFFREPMRLQVAKTGTRVEMLGRTFEALVRDEVKNVRIAAASIICNYAQVGAVQPTEACCQTIVSGPKAAMSAFNYGTSDDDTIVRVLNGCVGIIQNDRSGLMKAKAVEAGISRDAGLMLDSGCSANERVNAALKATQEVAAA